MSFLFSCGRRADRIELRGPVIVMVLAATAIPIEFRPPTYDALAFSISASLVFGCSGKHPGIRASGDSTLGDLDPFEPWQPQPVSLFSRKLPRLVMTHRDPSVTDVLSNILGAGLGVAIAFHWEICQPALAVSQKEVAKSQLLLFTMIVMALLMTSPNPPSTRGATTAGRLEGHWKLNESSGRIAKDSSGGGLEGRFSNEPHRVDRVSGRAVVFDGARDYINLGHPIALRLVGSMTISAWVKSNSYPVDDAAIVYESPTAGLQVTSWIQPLTGAHAPSVLRLRMNVGVLRHVTVRRRYWSTRGITWLVSTIPKREHRTCT